jgi:N-acylneuraminate cytidylyltransferase
MQPEEFSILIPIKKLSQRVPDKNYRIFGDRPLWQHTLDKLQEYRVYIDTDDDELIEAVKTYQNVVAYLRPIALRGHKVSVCDLIKNWVTRHDPKGFLFQIHVTSPFLKTSTLHAARASMNEEHDSVFASTKYQTRFWYRDRGVNHDPECLIQTQDLEPVYEENSLFYGFTKEVALQGKRVGAFAKLFETAMGESLDIDTEEDWDKCVSILEKENDV